MNIFGVSLLNLSKILLSQNLNICINILESAKIVNFMANLLF